MLNCNVGETIGFDELRARHDSVLIATGVYKAKAVTGPSEGVVQALDFLIAANKADFGDLVPVADAEALNANGKRVVVIGGGDTAMDCVRTARRQGAKSVVCLYRRDAQHAGLATRGVQRGGGGRRLRLVGRPEICAP